MVIGSARAGDRMTHFFKMSAAPIPSGIGLGQRALIIHVPTSATISLPAFEQLHPQILGALCTMASQRFTNPTPLWTPARAAPDAVATAIAKFLNHRTEWTSTATELLESLRTTNPNITWPGTPKGLTQLLNKTSLGNIDFQSLQDARSRRTIELRVISPKPTDTPPKDAPMRVKPTKQKLPTHEKSAATSAARDG